MKKRIPIGISNFREIREDNYYFVDKSMLIKELIQNGSKIILTPRPRRFGKTLNMSMIRYFFDINKAYVRGIYNQEKDNNETKQLFNGLAIEKEEEIMKLQGDFPVISVTFKDVKFDNFEDTLLRIGSVMSDLYIENKYLLESDVLEEIEKEEFKKIINKQTNFELLASAMANLTSYLHKYFKRQVIVLIDEYDVPIQEGYIRGYYDKIISFQRSMFTDLLKDNDNIKKALITGILRIAKESIFSGLNNLDVYSILDYEFNDKFGFKVDEVSKLIEYYEAKDEVTEITQWYNGYNFGDEVIYNPWSVLNYLKAERRLFKPYWINSSENALVRNLLSKGDEEIKRELQALINNETIEKIVDENIVMEDIESSSENIWSFLLMSGYLNAIKSEVIDGEYHCTLGIPNKEVTLYFRNMILKWFEESMTMSKYKTMLNALVTGDIEIFAGFFKMFVKNNISYFDVSGKEPEKVYHAFVLGILISLADNYEVKSNKESGYGRYDVMVIPKDSSKIGIIMEFKKIDDFLDDTIEDATTKALRQIEDKKYDTELIEKNIKNIIKLAIIFKGKEVQITKA